ncbi:hypothetical protein L3X38_020910 [Prunus dulcis]|uniref:Uncharacterized protein n=1 Tax=Prunus dulcis TaxID=3755 RepID=A0AAD4VUK6_PRUDU|nr:hypothetical protein L3X38_020910 [Prunus dulcis]
MEGEIPNFIMVWILAVASLSYCHTIGKLTSPGLTRLLAILPVIFFFFFLPLNLTTIFLGGPSSFFLLALPTSSSYSLPMAKALSPPPHPSASSISSPWLAFQSNSEKLRTK